MALPATAMSIPACFASFIVFLFIPPSTSIYVSKLLSSIYFFNSFTFINVSGINFCPPFPGSTVIIRTICRNGKNSFISSTPVFGFIEMSDDADKGGTIGNSISLIYKGDHYQYIVRTENEYDFIFDDEDLWNENDFVSLIIPKENISLKLK